MDDDSNFAQIRRVMSDFVDQFKLVSDEAEASETLIASAEYELDLLKQEFVRFSLPPVR
jgi:replication initiation and membrane attachment protein DnaB